MKLLVFAHTPPPHHGQSYMVKLMLDGFGGDRRRRRNRNADDNRFGVECYHVNARLSKTLADIGTLRPLKFLVLSLHCMKAIWCHFRYGIDVMYYIPAPGKRVALSRDWVVMTLCRPFFKHLILHWHAAGLGKWLETEVQRRVRAVTYRTMGHASVSIVLSDYNRADALKLLPRKVRVVHNGIADPCPEFEQSILPQRRARLAARLGALQGMGPNARKDCIIQVLYLAHCTREKGVFDAAEGVLTANAMLAEQGSGCRMVLSVAGSFLDEREGAEFTRFLQERQAEESIRQLGFVSGEQKRKLLEGSDVFCFPTFFRNENEPVNLIEALAFGLPVVTTRWRSVPEILPRPHPGLVSIRSPRQVAEALVHMGTLDCFAQARRHFLDRYLLDQHLNNLAHAIQEVENPSA